MLFNPITKQPMAQTYAKPEVQSTREPSDIQVSQSISSDGDNCPATKIQAVGNILPCYNFVGSFIFSFISPK